MASLEDKVIAITGAASGIGLATAHVLASRGATVSICDNRAEALELAVADIQKASPSAQVFSKTVDVSKRDDVKAWIDATVEKFGKLHGAANVAGVVLGHPGKPVQDLEDEVWYKTLDVNLNGVFLCMREQLRILEQGGSIVNISSTYGIVGAPNWAAYCASKHAVIGLSKCAAKEVGAREIRINCVAPGLTDTPAVAAFGITLENTELPLVVKRLARPEEVANVVAFLLGDESKYVTGSTYCVDGGLIS